MSGRGRGGRGGRGGANRSLSRDQLNSLGINPNEALTEKVTQPPPLYPLLHHQPVPVEITEDMEYLLGLRQDIIDHMQLTTGFLRLQDKSTAKTDQEIDKLLAQLPAVTRQSFDWELFPIELRPKMSAKRIKREIKKEVDVESRLNQLEKLEKTTGDVTIKEEADNEELEDEEMADEVDEEMDEGTDYANNYFDNGEDYDDEDDNLDDGPVY